MSKLKKKILRALQKNEPKQLVELLDESKGSYAVEYTLRLLLNKELGYTVPGLLDAIRSTREPAKVVVFTTTEGEDIEDALSQVAGSGAQSIGTWDTREDAEANAHELGPNGRLFKITATISNVEELEIDR